MSKKTIHVRQSTSAYRHLPCHSIGSPVPVYRQTNKFRRSKTAVNEIHSQLWDLELESLLCGHTGTFVSGSCQSFNTEQKTRSETFPPWNSSQEVPSAINRVQETLFWASVRIVLKYSTGIINNKLNCSKLLWYILLCRQSLQVPAFYPSNPTTYQSFFD